MNFSIFNAPLVEIITWDREFYASDRVVSLTQCDAKLRMSISDLVYVQGLVVRLELAWEKKARRACCWDISHWLYTYVCRFILDDVSSEGR